ncbi:hypothetical protein [Aeoliella mucimassa]|uniref:Uncharacterized protein n=1 Tax=Aeoliella mucimassa TaxID=2527972 RepID=A0A518AS29_9BACT|nr:hypothetical protein [Aeoliella mucimassa]QDU57516.1 hypothetical protein Pan181_37340 [Aeoliella mucimassa]
MARGKRNKSNIRYWQFEGGYARVEETQLRALLEGYRLGIFRRNEVRVFAARLEFAARHPNSNRLQLARILNWNSHRKGNRRLTAGQIGDAARALNRHLPRLQLELNSQSEHPAASSHEKPVARKVLRHIASGGATTVEALLCFAYFMRRIPQRKPMTRLKSEEQYARFTYAQFQEWTGVHRASQCRMMRRLIERGFLNTVPVVKQNENAYGQLFVDGQAISLVRRDQSVRRTQARRSCCNKKSTPVRGKVNAPRVKKSTLRNVNPKKEIEEQERFVSDLKSGYLGRHGDPALSRIAARAAQMVENCLRQAA